MLKNQSSSVVVGLKVGAGGNGNSFVPREMALDDYRALTCPDCCKMSDDIWLKINVIKT
jgi:hypothetical protein